MPRSELLLTTVEKTIVDCKRPMRAGCLTPFSDGGAALEPGQAECTVVEGGAELPFKQLWCCLEQLVTDYVKV